MGEDRKNSKYSGCFHRFVFIPFFDEILGSWGISAKQLVRKRGIKIKNIEKDYILPKKSVYKMNIQGVPMMCKRKIVSLLVQNSIKESLKIQINQNCTTSPSC